MNNRLRSLTLNTILLLLIGFASSCNRYLDVIRYNDSVPMKQGFFEFYPDSNLLIYKSKVVLTSDAEKIYPKSFKVKLPKKLKYYELFGSSDFALYYDKGQVIFIKVDLENKKPAQDTVYTPSKEQLNEFIQFKISTGNGKYDIKEIPFHAERKNVIIEKGSAVILLYNIYEENYDLFFDYVNEFSFIN